MDIRPYKPSADDMAILKKHCGYQPFILSDSCQAGAGYTWCTGKQINLMDKATVSAKNWDQFVLANAQMRTMYDDWISAICKEVAFSNNMTVVDTACNDGYFLYRFLQHGASKATGYDLLDKTPVFNVMNRLLGVNAEFHNIPYDSMQHRIPEAQPADIVISSAIMCHLSDPLYYLSFIGKLAKRALFLFSSIDPDPSFKISYEGANYYYKNPFPICFDKLNHVSSGLIEYGLRESGFTRIIEIPYQTCWLPWFWYKEYKAFIAIK